MLGRFYKRTYLYNSTPDPFAHRSCGTDSLSHRADNPVSPRCCTYINSTDQEDSLSVESVLRFVGTNDCNEESIDFMTSRAELALRPKQEDRSSRCVLTVAQGRQLLGSNTTVGMRNRVAGEVELATLDYALGEFEKGKRYQAVERLSDILNMRCPSSSHTRRSIKQNPHVRCIITLISLFFVGCQVRWENE